MSSKRTLKVNVSVDNALSGIEVFLRNHRHLEKDEVVDTVKLLKAVGNVLTLELNVRREVQLIQHTNGQSYQETGLQKRIQGIPCETRTEETSGGSQLRSPKGTS